MNKKLNFSFYQKGAIRFTVLVGLFILAVTLPIATILVQQRQEIRERAEESTPRPCTLEECNTPYAGCVTNEDRHINTYYSPAWTTIKECWHDVSLHNSDDCINGCYCFEYWDCDDSDKPSECNEPCDKPGITPSSPTCPTLSTSTDLLFNQNTDTVSWTAANGADYYNLRVSDKNNNELFLQQNGITNTWYTLPVDFSQPGHTYYWWLIADNSCGDANTTTEGPEFTIPAAASPTACSTPSMPDGLSFNQGTNTVSWNAVDGANHYNLRVVNTTNGDEFLQQNEITNTWYTFDSSLSNHPQPSRTYRWWMKTVNSCGESGVVVGSDFTIGLVLKSCDMTCSDDSECASGYCYGVDWEAGYRCRKEDCPEDSSCSCLTPTPTFTCEEICGGNYFSCGTPYSLSGHNCTIVSTHTGDTTDCSSSSNCYCSLCIPFTPSPSPSPAPTIRPECTNDWNCNDNNSCTADTCVNNSCKYTPISCNEHAECNSSTGNCQCSSGNWGNCDGNWSNGCETALTEKTNCGACGNQCGGDEICQERECVKAGEYPICLITKTDELLEIGTRYILIVEDINSSWNSHTICELGSSEGKKLVLKSVYPDSNNQCWQYEYHTIGAVNDLAIHCSNYRLCQEQEINCPQCPANGDFNGDGVVDEFDYGILIAHFGNEGIPGEVIGDANCDGVVDEFDYGILIAHFGEGE